MIIERILHFRGSRSRGDIQTLFDTGATYSCINRTHAQELAVLERLPDPLEMETARPCLTPEQRTRASTAHMPRS